MKKIVMIKIMLSIILCPASNLNPNDMVAKNKLLLQLSYTKNAKTKVYLKRVYLMYHETSGAILPIRRLVENCDKQFCVHKNQPCENLVEFLGNSFCVIK